MKEATPGEMYLRKLRDDPGTDKTKWLFSRDPVFQLWKDLPGELRVLTMPGLHWKFEEKLLSYRMMHRGTTHFTAVENDRIIFRMWDSHHRRGSNCECVDVEFYVEATNTKFTAAWLDWNGPLTTTKVECIRQLWPRLSHSLVLTFMAARYDGISKAMRDKAGGWGEMIAQTLRIPRSHVHQAKYISHPKLVFYQVTATKSKIAVPTPCRYINGIKLEDLV